MNRKALAIIALLGILVMGAAGCPKAGETGTLNMYITDAPADLNITKALVTVSMVQVHMAGVGEERSNETVNETEMTESNETEDNKGWFTVVSEAQTFDLIQIKDVREFLGSTELEAGKYTQVRLSIDKALVTIDGIEYDLKVPSTKLKLVRNFDIVAGQNTTLTLDFDAQESIVKAGKENYTLKPTIKVLQE